MMMMLLLLLLLMMMMMLLLLRVLLLLLRVLLRELPLLRGRRRGRAGSGSRPGCGLEGSASRASAHARGGRHPHHAPLALASRPSAGDDARGRAELAGGRRRRRDASGRRPRGENAESGMKTMPTEGPRGGDDGVGTPGPGDGGGRDRPGRHPAHRAERRGAAHLRTRRGEAREPPKAMHVPRREIPPTPFRGDERKRAVFRTRAFAGPAGPGARGAEVGLRWTAGTKAEPAVAERRLASFGTGPRDALWPHGRRSKDRFHLALTQEVSRAARCWFPSLFRKEDKKTEHYFGSSHARL